MRDHEYITMRALEDTYWWYQVLRSEVARDLAAHFSTEGSHGILDAGCGTGGMLEAIREKNPRWSLRGIDVSAIAVRLCQERGFENVLLGSVNELPFPDATFDALVCLDVLYHSEVSEERALSEMFRVLRPKGLLVMNVPAFNVLKGDHDIAVRGARRYTVRIVKELLRANGFRSQAVFYWNAWFFFPLVIWRKFRPFPEADKKDETKGDLFALPGWMNVLLTWLGRIDFALCRYLRLPMGTSVYSIAEKPQHHGIA